MTTQKLLLASMLALATLAGCAPMDTRDQPYYSQRVAYPQYERDDYRYGQDYRLDAEYRDDRGYQQGYAYDSGQSGQYYNNGRLDPGCNACGVVRRITRLTNGSVDNTGAIVVGALVGGALGNTVGHGDGRRAATVVGAVAGGAVANNLTRDSDRYDFYRIEVHMNNGDRYSFDQRDHGNLREGSPVEVRDGQVYPIY